MATRTKMLETVLASAPQSWKNRLEEYFSVKSAKRNAMLTQLWEDKANISGCLVAGIFETFARDPKQVLGLKYSQMEEHCFELMKYIGVDYRRFIGKKIVSIGCGFGLDVLACLNHGLDCSAVEASSFHRTGHILSCILNGFETSIRADDSDIDNFDVYLFGQVFYNKIWAEKNLATIQRLGDQKTMIVASRSLWLGTNEYVTLDKKHMKLLLETRTFNVDRYVWEYVP